MTNLNPAPQVPTSQNIAERDPSVMPDSGGAGPHFPDGIYRGEIYSFTQRRCPTCGSHSGPIVLHVEFIWDGAKWLVLDSTEGWALVKELATISVNPSQT